ncbi:hypothetical protein SKAU_G00407150 [Synaphobranchus kaupii]|uniref:Uncharacterized protein n=1 Tax=Synaphobranchus kaupii TaxID=118154 RepID=A0A9Q1EAA1_SYNKA|nr:hypothetical protein SKAU_G00407150 [Synaphobranchus kaupii]
MLNCPLCPEGATYPIFLTVQPPSFQAQQLPLGFECPHGGFCPEPPWATECTQGGKTGPNPLTREVRCSRPARGSPGVSPP